MNRIIFIENIEFISKIKKIYNKYPNIIIIPLSAEVLIDIKLLYPNNYKIIDDFIDYDYMDKNGLNNQKNIYDWLSSLDAVLIKDYNIAYPLFLSLFRPLKIIIDSFQMKYYILSNIIKKIKPEEIYCCLKDFSLIVEQLRELDYCELENDQYASILSILKEKFENISWYDYNNEKKNINTKYISQSTKKEKQVTFKFKIKNIICKNIICKNLIKLILKINRKRKILFINQNYGQSCLTLNKFKKILFSKNIIKLNKIQCCISTIVPEIILPEIDMKGLEEKILKIKPKWIEFFDLNDIYIEKILKIFVDKLLFLFFDIYKVFFYTEELFKFVQPDIIISSFGKINPFYTSINYFSRLYKKKFLVFQHGAYGFNYNPLLRYTDFDIDGYFIAYGEAVKKYYDNNKSENTEIMNLGSLKLYEPVANNKL